MLTQQAEWRRDPMNLIARNGPTSGWPPTNRPRRRAPPAVENIHHLPLASAERSLGGLLHDSMLQKQHVLQM